MIDINFTLLENIFKKLDDFVAKMKSVRDKLDLIEILRTQHKIDFLSTKESLENLILKSTKNLHMLFYNDDLKAKQRDIYDKHIEFLIQLSRQSKDASQNKFVIVDMDLHPQQGVKEIKTMWYENGKLESTNMLAHELQNDASVINKTGNKHFN